MTRGILVMCSRLSAASIIPAVLLLFTSVVTGCVGAPPGVGMAMAAIGGIAGGGGGANPLSLGIDAANSAAANSIGMAKSSVIGPQEQAKYAAMSCPELRQLTANYQAGLSAAPSQKKYGAGALAGKHAIVMQVISTRRALPEAGSSRARGADAPALRRAGLAPQDAVEAVSRRRASQAFRSATPPAPPAPRHVPRDRSAPRPGPGTKAAGACTGPLKQMRIALLALARTALDQLDDCRLAADQQVEIAVQVLDRREARHALGSCHQLMRRLRPAQHQSATSAICAWVKEKRCASRCS